MVNTHKPGYSTSEVAQVFGCSVNHIHQLINDKKLGAMITESKNVNGRRTIRIGREHIQQYMRDNPKRFSISEMRTWGVEVPEAFEAAKEKAEASKSTISYITGDPSAPGHIRKVPIGSLDAEKYPNKPTGAWADLLKDVGQEKKAEAPAPTPVAFARATVPAAPKVMPNASQTVSPSVEGPVVYSVLVNGKIAVSGITKETAVAITQALLNDTGTGEFNAIAILKKL